MKKHVSHVLGKLGAADRRAGLDSIWARLGPHVTGAYPNFLSSATGEDVAAIYPADTYDRLAALKRRYDPGNLFARNHNVRPGTVTAS